MESKYSKNKIETGIWKEKLTERKEGRWSRRGVS